MAQLRRAMTPHNTSKPKRGEDVVPLAISVHDTS